jgi:crossover junction endodeoxyribonuclease RusA
MIVTGALQMTLVYLCDLSPPDIDNIIKPIQDSLVGLVFSDDALIADVDSHRRFLTGAFNLTQLPPLITAGVISGQECVYVRVSESLGLEEYV